MMLSGDTLSKIASERVHKWDLLGLHAAAVIRLPFPRPAPSLTQAAGDKGVSHQSPQMHAGRSVAVSQAVHTEVQAPLTGRPVDASWCSGTPMPRGRAPLGSGRRALELPLCLFIQTKRTFLSKHRKRDNAWSPGKICSCL